VTEERPPGDRDRRRRWDGAWGGPWGPDDGRRDWEGGPGVGSDPDWPRDGRAWRRERRALRHAGGRRFDGPPFDMRGRRPPFGRRHGFAPIGCFGCAIAMFVLVIGGFTVLATWLAATVLGVVAPAAGPATLTGVAIAFVLLLGLGMLARAFVAYARPLADIADATGRLADGEPGVRVRARGPRAVRDLAISFNAMAERLDRSREDRKSLLADVTHELRTPLTVIAGGLEAMTDGVHPMDEDHVAPLLAETAQMSRLLDDLRTLSLAEAGALPLHREPTDLRALADDVVAAQGPMAAARGVELRAAGEASLETSVDPVRVREILTNLVANALRHTPPGGSVEVRVVLSAADAVLEVVDTGEGIPAADLPYVFDRFQRRADSGGSGLGLTIVRDLAAAHGGSVQAESEGLAGRGSRFRVVLPLRD